MSESKQVPRKEWESDLDWLARNVHVWPAGEHQPWCYVYWKGGRGAVSGNCIPAIQPCVLIDKSDWLARRAELQNKPSFADHPDARCFVQNHEGTWYKNTKSDNVSTFSSGEWRNNCMNGGWDMLSTGDILGDWRDTLEKRPTDLSEQAVTARLKDALDNVLTAAPELMTDKYKFEPFVSVEDAATSKQHDPVSNPSHYASGGIECIEAIKASMSHEAFLGYLKGNVQKYTWRYEKKVNPAEDLRKARWYLDKLIEEQK